MAKTKARDGGGETLQIVILTLFMTGGGFALISLVLALFLVPARANEVDKQIKDATSLAELLAQKNNPKTQMWDLRKKAKEAEKAEGSQSLRSRVEAQFGPLVYSSFPATVQKKYGNTIEMTQKVDFKEAKLQQVFDFVARVKQENPSVQVGQLRVSRPANRPGQSGDEDKWTTSVTFHLYSTTSSAARPAAPGKTEPEPVVEEQPDEAEAGAGTGASPEAEKTEP